MKKTQAKKEKNDTEKVGKYGYSLPLKAALNISKTWDFKKRSWSTKVDSKRDYSTALFWPPERLFPRRTEIETKDCASLL